MAGRACFGQHGRCFLRLGFKAQPVHTSSSQYCLESKTVPTAPSTSYLRSPLILQAPDFQYRLCGVEVQDLESRLLGFEILRIQKASKHEPGIRIERKGLRIFL